ncbi:MAG: EamA family transporter [Chitinophagaceae bacterium]
MYLRLASYRPTHVSIYAYINPIIAIGLGRLLLNEHLSIDILIGTLITLAEVYLVKMILKNNVYDCY